MTYTVKPGDSLSIIARDVLGHIDLWPEIALINDISDSERIYPGQVLQLPNVLPEFIKQAKPAKKTVLIAVSVLIVIAIAIVYYYNKKKR